MDSDVSVENARAGRFDFDQLGTTAMERLFNEHTAAAERACACSIIQTTPASFRATCVSRSR
jgi:hypothetical protein